jgi:NAD-dependent SIR2 family protein deacetylase
MQPTPKTSPDDLERLIAHVRDHRRLFVLTGAGCSTESGIPDYRDRQGRWKHRQPVMYQEFVRSDAARRRYWARSFVGWPRIDNARPNGAHHALACLESFGFIHQLVTQNVDGLHQRAGSRRVVDLHGRLDTIECLDCRRSTSRSSFQAVLKDLNPALHAASAATTPDGDVDLDDFELDAVRVPGCRRCGGVLKPAVIFFGEAVPRTRVEHVSLRLSECDAMLVVGTSLMVYSGYRFCRAASKQGKPIAAINLGRTRADAELTFKVYNDCNGALTALADGLHRCQASCNS